MFDFDDLLNLIIVNDEKENVFTTNDPNLEVYLESVYDSLFRSLLYKLKNDSGNYDDLDKIKNFKKTFTTESKRQYKIVLSCSKDNQKNTVKAALKKYKFLNALKFIIYILDLDEDYIFKTNECRKYFSVPSNVKLFDYLYSHSDTPHMELKQNIYGVNLDSTALTNMYDLIITKKVNNETVYSLSPKGKNLYAFYMMKDIDFEELSSNNNEGKINEILDYLIKYISTQSEIERGRLRQPSLKSCTANKKLKRVTSLIDKENSYSYGYFKSSVVREPDSKYRTGGNVRWNNNY